MERDDFDKQPDPALPLGVSQCIGCGGRVYSLEHDGYCEACNRIAAPDGEKHWKWTIGVFSDILRSDIMNPYIPEWSVKITATALAHNAFKLRPDLKQNAFDSFMSKVFSDCVNAR